jgi:uncharacterized protein (DUF1778 family)
MIVMSVMKTRDDRLSMRIDPQTKAVIAQAAQESGTTLTTFMVQHAYAAAEILLTEQRRFVLDDERWQKFMDALNAPPKKLSALQKLMSEPSVLEKQQSIVRQSAHTFVTRSEPKVWRVTETPSGYKVFVAAGSLPNRTTVKIQASGIVESPVFVSPFQELAAG